MGFQVPPTLPDYSKLTFMLNNSGVQKWNPAVYDILKNLIAAVQQSQDTFVSTTIEEITNEVINNIPAPIPTPGILSVNFAIDEGQMQILHSSPITLVVGVANKVIVPIMLVTRAFLNVNFGVNISGTLQWAAQPIDIVGPIQLFQSTGTPTALYCSIAPANISALANTIDNQGSNVILKGNADTGTGGTGTSNITGTFFYLLQN